jgi:apolipoprotein N-acyltransferase
MDRYRLEAVFFLPFIWLFLEILREFVPFGGFPWNLSGYMISYINPIAQISSITGIYGLSFLVLFLSVSVFYFFYKRSFNSFLIITFSFLCVVGLFIYGNIKINSYNYSGKKVKISIIQGNIPEDMKMSVEGKPQIIKKYVKLIKEAYYKDKPDLIVLPESSLPFPPLSINSKLKIEFLRDIKDVKVPMIIGFDNYFLRNEHLYLYNSMFLFNEKHKVVNYYNKIKLVPFGEYVPFPFKIFETLFPYLEGYDFMRGRQMKILVYKRFRILPLICFEGIFPNFVASNSKRKPNLIVNITNDAWFKKTSAPYQHFEMVRIRAIETGNFLVRAANTGISAFVSPTGKIIKSLGLFEEGYITAQIHLQIKETFFEKHRIQLFYFSLLLFLISLLYFEWRYKH